jgi:putative membrane protein
MWHSDDGMGWWMLFVSIVFLLFWASVIWLFLQAAWRGDRPTGREDTPLEIARRRYARGDISKEQFEELRRDLV